MSFYLCVFVVVSFLLLGCLSDDASVEWSYRDTKWGGVCMHGKKQSPVDLRGWLGDAALGEIEFNKEYHSVPSHITLKQAGKTVQLLTPNTTMSISHGPLPSSFTFLQLHFHWGTDNNEGSEHTIDGKAHALELHLVHWNSGRYTRASEAMKQQDGIAVLAVFVDVADKGGDINKELELLTHYFHQIRSVGEIVTIHFPFPLHKLLPSKQQYLTYQGSLTTPNCDEVVLWTVFKNPIYITHARMQAFRSFKGVKDSYLESTFRSVQPLNGRRIRLSPVFAILVTRPLVMSTEGAVSCHEIEKKKDRFVELLEVGCGREDARLEGFVLRHLEHVQWLLYRQHDKIGLKPSPSTTTLPWLEGGGLKQPHHLHDTIFLYNADNVLFQSPHTINNNHSPLEIHMIFYDKTKHKSFSQAQAKSAFIIVAITTKISLQNSTVFSPLDESLLELIPSESRQIKRSIQTGKENKPNLHHNNSHHHNNSLHHHHHHHHHHHQANRSELNEASTQDTYIHLSKHSTFKSFLRTLLHNNTNYYKYYGPTTFPHCAPSVQWLVRAQPIPITLTSSSILRRIHLAHPYRIMASNKNERISEILFYNAFPGERNSAARFSHMYPVVVVVMMMLWW